MSLKPYFLPDGVPEAGCDEAGRGCLAGPVVAAAVILPPDFFHPLLNDSKKCTPLQRLELKDFIERHALAWAVAAVEVDEIDRINILQASLKAMHLALDQLAIRPGRLLIDGNRFRPYPGAPHECVVRGDSLYAAIAAASILAKTGRDALMAQLHSAFPEYEWQRNKGYPTDAHRAAIRMHGVSPHHRRSFQLLPEGAQLPLF